MKEAANLGGLSTQDQTCGVLLELGREGPLQFKRGKYRLVLLFSKDCRAVLGYSCNIPAEAGCDTAHVWNFWAAEP